MLPAAEVMEERAEDCWLRMELPREDAAETMEVAAEPAAEVLMEMTD